MMIHDDAMDCDLIETHHLWAQLIYMEERLMLITFRMGIGTHRLVILKPLDSLTIILRSRPVYSILSQMNRILYKELINLSTA